MTEFACFLDANVLAAPVTRTLCIVGIERVGGEVWWSVHAEAEAAKAQYIVTADVDDIAMEDMCALRMSAANPDYFLAMRLSVEAYRAGVAQLAAGTSSPPRTGADVHRMLGRKHPRLTERFADAFDSTPAAADHDQPNVFFRGVICIGCGADLETDEHRRFGLCAEHLG